MMTCKQVTELVTDYHERRLSLWKRLHFRLHLGMCLDCHRYVNQMKAVARLAGGVAQSPTPPPPEVAEELRARFRNWKR